jgi:NAD(P)H-flavin reductase
VHFILPNAQQAPFSIANWSPNDHQLEFHFRHGPKHPVTEQFLNYLMQQQSIWLGGPLGQNILPHTERPLILLAGGTGIAPIKALLEAAVARQYMAPIRLYWGIDLPRDKYLPHWLTQLNQSLTDFKAQVILNHPLPNWKGATGLISEYLSNQSLDLAHALVYTCGPYPMCLRLKQDLLQRGLSAAQWHCDMG